VQIGVTRVLPLAHDSAVAVAAGRGEVVDAEDRDGGRATPSDAPSAPELRLSRRLERSRGRRTRRWRYAPSRFDFSDAPPVLGERGGQRSCSSLVWLGGGSGRWPAAPLSPVSGRCPDNTLKAQRVARGDDVPGGNLGSTRPVELARLVRRTSFRGVCWSSSRSNSSWGSYSAGWPSDFEGTRLGAGNDSDKFSDKTSVDDPLSGLAGHNARSLTSR